MTGDFDVYSPRAFCDSTKHARMSDQRHVSFTQLSDQRTLFMSSLSSSCISGVSSNWLMFSILSIVQGRMKQKKKSN